MQTWRLAGLVAGSAFAAMVASCGGGSGGETASTSPPVSSIVLKAALPTTLAGCPWAPPTDYWVARVGDAQFSRLTIDFGAMTAQLSDPAGPELVGFALAAETDGTVSVPCGVQFTEAGDSQVTFTMRFSKAGIAALGAPISTGGRPDPLTDRPIGIAVPVQRLSLHDLVGTWNDVGFDLGEDDRQSPTWGTLWTTGFDRIQVSEGGHLAMVNCTGQTPPATLDGSTPVWPTQPAYACGATGGGELKLVPQGGSDGLFTAFVASDRPISNVAAYRAASGDLAMVSLLAKETPWAKRSIHVASMRVTSTPRRTVGESWSVVNWRAFNSNPRASGPGQSQGMQSATPATFTTEAVDSTGTVVDRLDNHGVRDRLYYDLPFTGMAWRPGLVTGPREIVGVTGEGWSVFGSTASNGTSFLLFSINEP